MSERENLIELLTKSNNVPAVFVEEVADYLLAHGVTIPVRCSECMHCVPLERNCELNTSIYRHCSEWHGEEEKNVWHKYQRYYRDYSIVEDDDYCSYGERKDNETD